jgi:hypothetical protein
VRPGTNPDGFFEILGKKAEARSQLDKIEDFFENGTLWSLSPDENLFSGFSHL